MLARMILASETLALRSLALASALAAVATRRPLRGRLLSCCGTLLRLRLLRGASRGGRAFSLGTFPIELGLVSPGVRKFVLGCSGTC